MSYLEIYNEDVRDLLSKDQSVRLEVSVYRRCFLSETWAHPFGALGVVCHYWLNRFWKAQLLLFMKAKKATSNIKTKTKLPMFVHFFMDTHSEIGKKSK